MDKDFSNVRNMLANLAMENLWRETRKLIRKSGGYDGAKIFLRAQYQAVCLLQEELEKENTQ